MNIRTLETRIDTFVKSGFKKHKFTNDIYEALHINSSKFIAHFDKDGFYRARFESREGLKTTLELLSQVKPTDQIKRVICRIPNLYEDAVKTYKLGEPIFKVVNERVGVFFDTNTKFDTVTNLLGYSCAYIGKGSGFVKTLLEMTRTPIVVNCDFIACDWILNLPDQGLRVDTDRLIILVNTGTKDGHCGASEKRLKHAQVKLKSLGYKTKYCDSISSAEKFVQTLKINKAA